MSENLHGQLDKLPKEIKRWDIHQRIQHILIFTSFTVLGLTGLPIKFSHMDFAKVIMSWFGSFDAMFMAHVFAGWTMVFACVYHLAWLFVRGFQRKLGIAIIPSLKDVTDVVDTIKYYIGATDVPPHYDRYSYKEKFDYLAVFWGMFVIGGSGIFMTFPELGTHYFPRFIIDMWRIAHSDEAVLAVTFIGAVHFYNVHLSPDFFPASWHWWTGKMAPEVMAHEHPDELKRILAKLDQGGQNTVAGSSHSV